MHALIRELADNDRKHDPWGSAIAAAFTCCDVLYVEGRSDLIPVSCGYRPAMGTSSRDDVTSEDWGSEDIFDAIDAGEITHEGIASDLATLDRYLDLCRHFGRDY